MCTVTFIPTDTGIYLTSNRDEHADRGKSSAPKKYSDNNYSIIYPRDSDAGGSWIAMKSSGDAAVLLNGAFVKHERKTTYRRSRGLIFIEIMKAERPDIYFNELDLTGIEPFTIVMFFNRRLYELRWDGRGKHISQPDATVSHIWSSATLYDETAINKRRNWFRNWQHSRKTMTTECILDFHKFGGSDDPENALLINRNGKIRTVSITSIRLSAVRASMTYQDLLNEQQFCETMIVRPKLKPGAVSFLQVKKMLIRILNREFWPHNLVYAPLYAYWIWLSLKARSFFFFNASNPRIMNGGFLMESKKEIYDLMPIESYPKTMFCKAELNTEDLKTLMTDNDFSFPLIAKPDIGLRGIQVELLQNENDLVKYLEKNKVDFLLQKFIDYDHEVGIFYYRIPGEEKGHISGIVGKEFVTVVGDGKSTIEELLMKQDRYLLQLQTLKASLGKSFYAIPARGKREVLVHIGNHSRGAKFVDLSHMICDKLVDQIDTFCKKVPEFYYGRLDIKFNSWIELCEGKNFSVIELNGAGSEPTHIYDPAHSLLFVWKEVIRHWHLLYRISGLNAQQLGINYMTTADGMKMFSDHAKYLKRISP